MKKLLASAFLAFTLVSAANAETIATVNGKEVSRAELEASLAELTGKKQHLEDAPLDLRKKFIEEYVNRRILLDDARAKGVNKDPEIVDSVRSAEDYLVLQKYASSLILKQKTEAKLKQLFNEKYAAKNGGEEVKASHILVKTEAEAKAIKAELNKGGNFEKIAKEKSIDTGSKPNGGDLGYFIAEQMVPEFSKVAFSQKIGTVSEPVQSQFGWHIIKVVDKRKRKPLAYKDVQQQVEQDFNLQVVADKITELKKSAKIEYKINLNPPSAATPAAPAPQPKRIVVDSNINKPAAAPAAKPAQAAPTQPAKKQDGKK